MPVPGTASGIGARLALSADVFPRVFCAVHVPSVHVGSVRAMSSATYVHATPAVTAVAPAPAPAAAVTVPPAIGSVGVPASGAAPVPTIGSVGAVSAPAPVPTIGSVAGYAPNPAAPVIGSVAPSVSQRISALDDPPALARKPYEPPTATLPDAPEVPGKWVPQYTRDFKKYVVPGLDGIRQTETFVRATSHAKTLDDSTALTDWRLRGTVLGLARNPELLDRLNIGDIDHLSELDFGSKLSLSSVSNAAMRAVGGDDGSDFGTKLHGYLQAVLEGVLTLQEVPEMLRPYLKVLFAAMRHHGLSFVQGMVERTVFIPATGMVGTLDFMAMTPDGDLVIGDLKTSSSIDFGWLAIAIQLAQYANAQMMLSWDGTRWEAMPAVSKVYALVASVPKDEPSAMCRIYVVDLQLGTEMMALATRVQAIHEAARRGATCAEMVRPGDELIAWAAGEPVTLATAAAA